MFSLLQWYRFSSSVVQPGHCFLYRFSFPFCLFMPLNCHKPFHISSSKAPCHCITCIPWSVNDTCIIHIVKLQLLPGIVTVDSNQLPLFTCTVIWRLNDNFDPSMGARTRHFTLSIILQFFRLFSLRIMWCCLVQPQHHVDSNTVKRTQWWQLVCQLTSWPRRQM